MHCVCLCMKQIPSPPCCPHHSLYFVSGGSLGSLCLENTPGAPSVIRVCMCVRCMQHCTQIIHSFSLPGNCKKDAFKGNCSKYHKQIYPRRKTTVKLFRCYVRLILRRLYRSCAKGEFLQNIAK